MALMTKSTDDPKVTRWWWRTLRQWIYELVDPLWAAFRGENSADISLTNVTGINGVSAAELTVLDGLTASTAELNKLSGLTADADELNKTDRAQADGIAEASKVATLDGNKDILGKRYDINQSLLDAQAGPPTFRFDGTDDHIQYDGNVLSGYPFTLWARFKTDSVSGAIVYFNDKDAGNIKFGINIDDNGKLVIQAQISASYSGVSVDAYNDGHWHTVFGLFRSDTDRELFVDGISVATSTNSQSYSAAIDRLSIGRLGDSTPSNYFQGEIDLVLVFNRALSTDEIKALASGGWPDHADRGASQTDLVTNGDDWTGASGSTPPNSWSDSGAGTASYLIRDNAGVANMDDKVLELDTVGGSKTLYQAILTTGKRYRVSFVYRNLEGSTPTYVAAGSANSKANLQHTLITGDGIIFSQEFTADGTDLMFVVDSGGKLQVDAVQVAQIGYVVALRPARIGQSQWQDASGNQLHGTVTGAQPCYLPSNHVERYVKKGIAADTSLTDVVPAGYRIDGIIVKETAGNAITGGLKIGTAAGGTDVVNGQAVAANALVDCTLALAVFSLTTAQSLYVADVTSWNGASIDLYLAMTRMK